MLENMGVVPIALPSTPRYKDKNSGTMGGGGKLYPQQHRSYMEPSMPHYISPVLLRLIASNAPLELDLFSDLMNKSKVSQRLSGNSNSRRRRSLEDPVEALLATVRQYNKMTAENGHELDSCKGGSDLFDIEEETKPKKGQIHKRSTSSNSVAGTQGDPKRGGTRERKPRVPSDVPFCTREVKEEAERPMSARTGCTMRVNGEKKTRRRKNPDLPPRPFSPRDAEEETGNMPERIRPSSASPMFIPERGKAVWRKPGFKALEDLERNFRTRPMADEDESLRSRPCSRLSSGHSSDCRPRCRREEMTVARLYGSKWKRCSRRHEVEQGWRNSPYSRPLTAPTLFSRGPPSPAATSKVRKRPDTAEEAKPKPSDLQKSVEPLCYGTRSVAVATASPPAPLSATPRGSEEEQFERDEDNFKDYLENAIGDSSTCSSDIEDETEDVEVEVECQRIQPVTQSIPIVQTNKQPPVKRIDTRSKRPVKQETVKRGSAETSPASGSCISSEDGVKELVTGVHDSLAASSKLAEVVELCSRRGQELLRARENMKFDSKSQDRFSRSHSKFHRSKHRTRGRRALRTELKWAIFSNNGNKTRALSSIYGNNVFLKNKLSSLRVERDGKDFIDKQLLRKRPSKRPATAPADVHYTPAREDASERDKGLKNANKRNESFGPWRSWTPTLEMCDTRPRLFEPSKFLASSKYNTGSEDMQRKKKHHLTQEAAAVGTVEPPGWDSSFITVDISKKKAIVGSTPSPRSFRGWSYRS